MVPPSRKPALGRRTNTAVAELDANVPRWAGITEPSTVITNLLLGALAFVLAVRLGYAAAADRRAAALGITAGLLATSVASTLGACAHGIDPCAAPTRRAVFWRASLHTAGLAGAATLVSVAFFATRGTMRTALFALAAVKLGVYTWAVARRPEFRITAADYGSAFAVLFIAAAVAGVLWQSPGARWLIAGVIVSLVAGVVQWRRLGVHRHFNHNDLFHVIQMAALYLFYRGGALLVDR